MNADIRIDLAEYFEQWADVIDQEPVDRLKEPIAQGLRELASHVRSLPPDDPSLLSIRKAASEPQGTYVADFEFADERVLEFRRDAPDESPGNLRRSTDLARGIMERTRGTSPCRSSRRGCGRRWRTTRSS